MDAAAVAGLFDLPVEACVAGRDLAPDHLTPEEAACIAAASPGRRAEYALGRTVMRAALRRLGATAISLPSRPDRSPRWPDGCVGSLSHCEGFCAAVAARSSEAAGLGFDAECARPLDADAAELVCGPGDRPDGPLGPMMVFSAKEAVYKCQHPVTGVVLDFPDLSIAWAASQGRCSGRFEARLRPDAARGLGGRRVQGGWRIAAGFVLTGAWIAP